MSNQNSEILGGLHLVLPARLRIKPLFTAWVAAGLAVVMAIALVFQLYRGESALISMNIILALVAAFIAWGRFKKAPILLPS